MKFQTGAKVKVCQVTHNGLEEIVRGVILSEPTDKYNYYTILIDNPYDFKHPFFVARENEITEIK